MGNGFFGIGIPEMLLIAVLALIFIGPQRLPEVIGQIMRAFREIRNYAQQMQDELSGEFQEIRQEMQEFGRELSEAGQEIQANVNEVGQEVSSYAQDLQSTARNAYDEAKAPSEPVLNSPPPPREEHALFPVLEPPRDFNPNGAAGRVGGYGSPDRPGLGDYRPGGS